MPAPEIPKTAEVRELFVHALTACHTLAQASACPLGVDVFDHAKAVARALEAANVEAHRRGRSDG